jgi:protoporphyrinogen oxidase
MPSPQKTAIIIGAGPAGLTAAYELLKRTDIKPILLEVDPEYVGGISRTVRYKGNRIDIGGHRFFSKSDRVMRWWAQMLPIRLAEGEKLDITYQRTTRALTEGLQRAVLADGDRVMHPRPRKTRICYGGTFYAYPIELSWDTLRKLGPFKVIKIGFSYLYAVLFPIKPEVTLEDFFLNRFGRELYETFFKSYTEKVWGRSCDEMSAEWGAQRVKGLSITKALKHAAQKTLRIGALSGKSVETSLIEQFLYPTYGPGLMWETVADKVRAMGGEIYMGTAVTSIQHEGGRIARVEAQGSGGPIVYDTDHVFSTTDVRALARMMAPALPIEVREVSDGLEYRDFITVGLLLDHPLTERDGTLIKDTWMYVHEPGVKVGRVQVFNNWIESLVADPRQGWIGLEYFCDEGDDLWQKSDEDLIKQGEVELRRIGLLIDNQVLDGTVIRQKKAYPGYFGSYDRFGELRGSLDQFENLYLIGRNGMHRYNNQDHSMLAAMAAIDAILGQGDRDTVWGVNTEEEYHESK